MTPSLKGPNLVLWSSNCILFCFAALKGAATLKARSEFKNKSSGGVASVLPIEDNYETEIDVNIEKARSTLAKGVLLKLESPDGKICNYFKVKFLRFFF